MIGLKDQCFGVEVELTGITRQAAAQALAEYFETSAVFAQKEGLKAVISPSDLRSIRLNWSRQS